MVKTNKTIDGKMQQISPRVAIEVQILKKCILSTSFFGA